MARHLPRQAGTGWPLPDQLRTTPFLHALRERAVDVRTRMAGSDPSVCFCNRQHLAGAAVQRSEEHTSELQSLMRISYAVFCLKKKRQRRRTATTQNNTQGKKSGTHRNDMKVSKHT